MKSREGNWREKNEGCIEDKNKKEQSFLGESAHKI